MCSTSKQLIETSEWGNTVEYTMKQPKTSQKNRESLDSFQSFSIMEFEQKERHKQENLKLDMNAQKKLLTGDGDKKGRCYREKEANKQTGGRNVPNINHTLLIAWRNAAFPTCCCCWLLAISDFRFSNSIWRRFSSSCIRTVDNLVASSVKRSSSTVN